LPAVLDAANEQTDDAFLKHSSLPEVFDAVSACIGDKTAEWPRHVGEFRSGERAHLRPGVLSARMWLKQVNQECEDLPAPWTEPSARDDRGVQPDAAVRDAIRDRHGALVE